MQTEAFGQVDNGNVDGRKAEGTVTDLTVEMCVHVVDSTGVFVGTDLVLQWAAAVFDVVYHVVRQEMIQRTEDGGAVDSAQKCFKIDEWQGTRGFEHGFQHQDAYGCRFYSFLFESDGINLICFHDVFIVFCCSVDAKIGIFYCNPVASSCPE